TESAPRAKPAAPPRKKTPRRLAEIRQITAEADQGSDAQAPADLDFPQQVEAELAASPATSIDLGAALRLAGLENPDVVLSRQRVEAVVAQQQFAAAQILPTLNAGTNYDAHTGVLQQSSGKIINLERSALYIGAGANAVAAGTVSIPGLS